MSVWIAHDSNPSHLFLFSSSRSLFRSVYVCLHLKNYHFASFVDIICDKMHMKGFEEKKKRKEGDAGIFIDPRMKPFLVLLHHIYQSLIFNMFCGPPPTLSPITLIIQEPFFFFFMLGTSRLQAFLIY